MKENENWSK